VNAVAVASIGSVIAGAIYLVASEAINAYYAEHLGVGEKAVQLHASEFAWAFAGALAVSVVPALWGGSRAAKVEAADELRET
jgi:hypothetical protein